MLNKYVHLTPSRERRCCISYGNKGTYLMICFSYPFFLLKLSVYKDFMVTQTHHHSHQKLVRLVGTYVTRHLYYLSTSGVCSLQYSFVKINTELLFLIFSGSEFQILAPKIEKAQSPIRVCVCATNRSSLLCALVSTPCCKASVSNMFTRFLSSEGVLLAFEESSKEQNRMV